MADDRREHVVGALLGLAVGDALGTTLEFKRPGSFKPIGDMVGGGLFGLKPGQWTDDTSMALCLAESLIQCRGFDPVDQLTRYVRWWREGHFSSTGRCFDIGNQTRTALSEYEQTGKPCCGPTGPHNAGNGSLMRLAPVAMAYWRNAETAVHLSAESSRTTHGARCCVDACRYFGGLLVGAFCGLPKETILSAVYEPVRGLWSTQPLCGDVAAVASGSFKSKHPPHIRGTGYVVDCLEAALWAFFTTANYRDAVLAAVNLGDDADTTGAVVGQLAGAYYGRGAIPEEWLSKLAMKEQVMNLACRLNECLAPPAD